MKSSPAALCGVSLSLAVSMYVVVRRAHLYKTVWASSSSSSSTTTTTTTTTSSKGSASSAAAGTSTSSVTKVVNGKTVTITTTTTRTVKSGSASSSTTSSSSEQTSYFKKDDAIETARIASDQEFADGSSVKVHGHGTGKVLHYIPQSKSYKVEIHEHGKTVQKTVPLVHISHIKVKDFFIYPIKSCRGIKVDHAEITPQGIANDRTWMVVDTKGKFITQRRYAKLAVLVPKLDDLVHPTAVTLTAEGMEDLHVPIVREGHGPEVTTKVWSSDMVAIDQGDAAAKWLNKFLEDVREDREFRLVRVKDSFRRPTNPKYAPHHDTKFADAYPFLLALDASLTEVNEHLKDKIPMDRFRPNIVLTGAPAFADESWDALTIGGIVFRNVKPCDRCAVPTVDQETGVASPEGEPRKTLVPLRNGADLGFQNGSDQSYYFGSNLVAESVGQLSVGAPVKILTIKHAVYA